MSRRPVRKVVTAKPVASPLPQRAKAAPKPAPKRVAAARTIPSAKRSAPAPYVRTPPGPLAAKLPAAAVARKGPRITSPKAPVPQTGMALHTATGARKYLTAGERDAFLRQADVADRPVARRRSGEPRGETLATVLSALKDWQESSLSSTRNLFVDRNTGPASIPNPVEEEPPRKE